MSIRSSLTRIVATGAFVALPVLASAAPAHASDEVRTRVSCSSGSRVELRAKPRKGGIETEFKVRSRTAGQAWSVSLSDNSTSLFSGSKTSDSRGEFRVRLTHANQVGTDVISGQATNSVTGESCAATINF